ncbi:MAG: flagellar export protein FliJ [Rhodopirellula sp. JB053]|uniref:flagellar export protein FliJ n=1 Tax=Rhodopirellula sp. JB044 TaxID=3342844 RepID=UPI003709EBD9
MAPFRFRFDSLLALRQRRRDEVGAEVGKATEAIERVDEQIELLQTQRDGVRNDAAARLANSGADGATRVAVDRVIQEGRYDMQLSAEQVALRDTRAKLEVELNRRRGLLVEAEAEVKQLERLRETQMAEHRQLQLQVEQAEADDLTTARMVIAQRRALKKN